PVFLEETLSAFGSSRGAKDWQRHLEFALDVCNGGIFLDKEQIWHNELVAGRGDLSRGICFQSGPARITTLGRDSWKRCARRPPLVTYQENGVKAR
ncbi:MAG: hypothetical protein L0312_34155, partial [Acidobacteria bacterium]|nr:hypothetical protein [Acidobacteriota bacterium]